MTEYGSFRAFVEDFVLPMQQAHPEDKRLDGQPSGGNLNVAGIFWHKARRWKVHADTHYRPLLVAYEALRSREFADPFVETPTQRGTCLDLTPILRARTGDPDKHLYIYEIPRTRAPR